VCVRSALQVAHRQARETGLGHLGVNSRQSFQPPCDRPSRGVHAQCPRGRTPSSTRDEPQSLGHKQPAKISASLRPLTSRCARAVPSRSHTVPSFCQAHRLQLHPPRPRPHPRSAPPPHTSHTMRLVPATASFQPAAAPGQRKQTSMSCTPPPHGRACAAAPRQRHHGHGGSGGVEQQEAAMLRAAGRDVPATGATEEERGGGGGGGGL
jgi:hypothetical protein